MKTMKKSSTRKDGVKFVDPVTRVTEYRHVDKITCWYEAEEKVPIALEFPSGTSSAESLVEKYHICSVQALYAWAGKYVS